ncbi:MAG: phosphodiester glycosidase family protein [Polyangiales bacterium]
MVASILRRRPARASTALAVVLGLTSAAHAKDVWRRPRPGLRHLHRTVGGFDFHVVMVDLRAPGVRVVATPEEFLAPTRPGGIYRWRTTTAFAQSVGAEVAVNANYYDIHHGALTACGLAMSRGEAWQSSYVDRRLDCWWSAGFGSRGRGEIFDSRGKVFGPAPERWITEAVSGSPRVLDHGEVVRVTHPRHALSRNPRTVVGFDRERETLFLMVVNGREGRNQGMTTAEAGAALRDLGGYDAINLDGGGSSTLYVRAEGGMVSYPADRYERPVANHLAVVFDENPAPEPDTAPDTAPEAPRLPAPAIPWIPRQQPNIDLGSPRVVRAGCDASPRPAGHGAFWLLGAALAFSARRRSPRPPTRESLRAGAPPEGPAG